MTTSQRPKDAPEAGPLQRGRLRVAIVGHGSIGRRHLANLEQLGVRRRIVVRRRIGANPAFSTPPDVVIVHSDHEAIAAGVDAAIICNPTKLHVSTADAYLAAGVPVLIEKPLCAPGDEDAAAGFVKRATEANITASMAYCLRYHPAYRMAHDVLADGRLGRLLSAKAWFESYLPDWHPWEDYRQSYAARADLGGGVLPTLDHEIDFLNWCLGPPREVSGRVTHSGTLEIEVPDSASLQLTYGDGVMASLSLSLARRQRSRGFEFVGQRGTLRFNWSDESLELISLDCSTERLWPGGDRAVGGPAYEQNAMYRELVEAFLLALEQRTAVPIPLSAGLDSIRVCRAVLDG